MSVTISIDNLTHDGRGVGRLNGKTVFVEGALPLEVVDIELINHHRHYDEARVTNYAELSIYRTQPPCQYFASCGGCVLQHLHPRQQLAIKEQNFWYNLKKISGLEPKHKLGPLDSPSNGYRHRARFHVQTKKNKIGMGFKTKEHHDSIVLVDDCCVLVDELRALLNPVQATLRASQNAASIEFIELIQAKEGSVIWLRLRDNLSSQDFMLWMQLANNLSLILMTQCLDNSLVCHSHDLNVLKLSYPFPTIDTIMQFLPGDFTQINPFINEKMLASALEMMNLQQTDCIADWCGGIGNFALACAPYVQKVIGAEVSARMVTQSKKNALINGYNNTHFEWVDMDQAWSIDKFLQQHKIDSLIIDPPRQGAQALVEKIYPKKLKSVLYVSCHPATFARDAQILVKNKFKFKSARVIDMFPHTSHLEVMALFVQ